MVNITYYIGLAGLAAALTPDMLAIRPAPMTSSTSSSTTHTTAITVSEEVQGRPVFVTSTAAESASSVTSTSEPTPNRPQPETSVIAASHSQEPSPAFHSSASRSASAVESAFVSTSSSKSVSSYTSVEPEGRRPASSVGPSSTIALRPTPKTTTSASLGSSSAKLSIAPGSHSSSYTTMITATVAPGRPKAITPSAALSRTAPYTNGTTTAIA